MPIRRAQPCELTALLERYPGIEPVLCRGENGYTLLEQQATLEQQENRVIGLVSVFRREIPAPLGGLWEDFINVIEVFEERDRRQGTASALVQAVLAAARGKGSIQVRAYCDIRNEASHRLWLKNGFGINPATQSDGSIAGSFVSFRL